MLALSPAVWFPLPGLIPLASRRTAPGRFPVCGADPLVRDPGSRGSPWSARVIADTGTNRVRQVSSSGIITTVAGTGVAAPGGEATPAATTPVMTPLDPLYANLRILDY
jgi:hypothetical protein